MQFLRTVGLVLFVSFGAILGASLAKGTPGAWVPVQGGHEPACPSVCAADGEPGVLPPDWQVQWISESNGKGTGDCVPCKDCEGTLQVTYSGTGSWLILWGSVENASGVGTGNVQISTSTPCDGDPDNIVATDSSSSTPFTVGGLFCPCQ